MGFERRQVFPFQFDMAFQGFHNAGNRSQCWLLETMDYAHKAHHFWVRPTLPEPPSAYFRRNCFATFQEDDAGLRMVEAFGLVDHVMWANDYPHHEGTWPHSAEAIERTMGHLSDATRADILGLNAARFLNLEVPAKYRN